jgi:hypothetical protein
VSESKNKMQKPAPENIESVANKFIVEKNIGYWELLEELNFEPFTLDEMIYRKIIPVRWIGGKRRFRKNECRDALAKSMIENAHLVKKRPRKRSRRKNCRVRNLASFRDKGPKQVTQKNGNGGAE